MNAAAKSLFVSALCAASVVAGVAVWPTFALNSVQQTQQADAPAAASRRVGKIKAINGMVITLTTDSGPEVTVNVQDVTRIRRIAPGETNPKNATVLDFTGLQIGDLIRVIGIASDDGKSLAASSIVALKAADVEAKHQQDLQDWQKRGVDGPASADAGAANVTIKTRGKDLVIRTSASTLILRYPPDSWKFEDAKPGALQQIHKGDQVRARGDRSSDGNELTADEIVSGTFRNIAGTVNSVDASSSTLNVHDLLSKKTVTVKITQDSQLHQLPSEMAQRFAARLKRTAGAGIPGAPSSPDSSAKTNAASSSGPAAGSGARGSGMGSGGAPDLQQMLSRLPALPLNDLHKGDAVIILATEGTAGTGTTIALLTGVEPILRAAPNAAGASILTPWSLSAPSGDAGGP